MEKTEKKTRLRSGFTTGACAAAAAKAACLMLVCRDYEAESVEIPFPDGARHRFSVHASEVTRRDGSSDPVCARASVIKDAGDDPDVTNGAEIMAEVRAAGDSASCGAGECGIRLVGGKGVGKVTRPGLPVPPGRPAINPGPAVMIESAVSEALAACDKRPGGLEVIISVKDGERLAEKTLNRRLGIVGGISILGTTGIVKPVSAKAWTDTIEVSMSVARAAGLGEIVLSTGRTSERRVQEFLGIPEEGLVMMGDYLGYSLRAARRHGFHKVHLAGMWAKVLKAALGIPQTHVRNGALEVRDALELLVRLGLPRSQAEILGDSNTAREIYERLAGAGRKEIIRAVCQEARRFAVKESGLDVVVYLVTSESGIVLVV